jgi:hypothetical protein
VQVAVAVEIVKELMVLVDLEVAAQGVQMVLLALLILAVAVAVAVMALLVLALEDQVALE